MDILAIKTFSIVAVMLVATAYSSKLNKAFETKTEFWSLFLGGMALIFIIPAVGFPVNLVLALVFAVIMGLFIGPGIQSMMHSFVMRKKLQSQGYTKERLEKMTAEEREGLVTTMKAEVESGRGNTAITEDWNNIVGLAIYSTAGITIATAVTVFMFDFDFSFLGSILFIALLGLIIVGLLNVFFFKSPLLRLISSYIGAVIFSAYLLYDFNRLKEAAGDVTWETAINIAISIYLDIVNLFLDLLQIFSDSN